MNELNIFVILFNTANIFFLLAFKPGCFNNFLEKKFHYTFWTLNLNFEENFLKRFIEPSEPFWKNGVPFCRAAKFFAFGVSFLA